jgi:phosphate transport system substrate-binding protein
MKGSSMTSNSTRKTAQVVALTALAAAVAGAQLSATANSTRTYPTMTYPVHSIQMYQRPAYGFHRFTQGTLRKTYVAGGATLPALGYEGLGAKTNNPSTPAAGSVFGYYQSVLSGDNTVIQYCQTGSGTGKKIFNGTIANGVNLACAAIGQPPVGFGAPQSGTGFPISWPDVAGSDSPMSESEYSTFTTNRGTTGNGTEATELPEIAGAIAIFYNNPDTGSTQIHLTDANICGMVLGTITNWSQLGFPSRPLSFTYRSDGSGTTFGFSNHLSAVCGSASITNTQQFTGTAAVCSVSPFCVVNTAPACSIVGGCGASGNQGVANLIAANVGAIGYVEAANAHDSLNTAKGINFALVNGKDPIKNLPESVAKLNGSTSVAKDSVVVITQGKEATTTALSPAAKHAGCVLLVKPSAYAKITTGYSIFAVSYQLYAYDGNGANNAKLRTLAQELTKSGIVYNNQPGTKNITTVDAATSTTGTGTTGFANLGSSFQTPVKTASNACINS